MNMHARTNRKTDILKQLINTKCGKHRHLKDGSTLKNNFQKTFLRLSINWSNRTEVIRDRSWNIQYKTPRLYHETTRLQHQVMNINIAYQTPVRVHDHNIKFKTFNITKQTSCILPKTSKSYPQHWAFFGCYRRWTYACSLSRTLEHWKTQEIVRCL